MRPAKNLLWLIRKYVKAEIMEQGKFEPTEDGSAQGSVMSPMLANIYMHHVLTLWFKLVVQKEMQGECFLVNYKNWIYDNRNRPMREIIKELNVKLIGHYRYYGVTWNFRKITTFLHRVQQFLFKAMNRGGCRRAYT